jgi:hypothetical protein
MERLWAERDHQLVAERDEVETEHAICHAKIGEASLASDVADRRARRRGECILAAVFELAGPAVCATTDFLNRATM